MVLKEMALVTLYMYLTSLFKIARGDPVLKITAIDDIYAFYIYRRNYARIVSCNN